MNMFEFVSRLVCNGLEHIKYSDGWYPFFVFRKIGLQRNDDIILCILAFQKVFVCNIRFDNCWHASYQDVSGIVQEEFLMKRVIQRDSY